MFEARLSGQGRVRLRSSRHSGKMSRFGGGDCGIWHTHPRTPRTVEDVGKMLRHAPRTQMPIHTQTSRRTTALGLRCFCRAQWKKRLLNIKHHASLSLPVSGVVVFLHRTLEPFTDTAYSLFGASHQQKSQKEVIEPWSFIQGASTLIIGANLFYDLASALSTLAIAVQGFSLLFAAELDSFSLCEKCTDFCSLPTCSGV